MRTEIFIIECKCDSCGKWQVLHTPEKDELPAGWKKQAYVVRGNPPEAPVETIYKDLCPMCKKEFGL